MEWEEEGIRICTSLSSVSRTTAGLIGCLSWDLVGNFPHAHVPLDLTLGLPIPALWSKQYLKASWASTACPMKTYFNDMSIVFDMTLCGDWAGNVYSTSGCPGNCTTQIMSGANFKGESGFSFAGVNLVADTLPVHVLFMLDAYWEVNYVAVYQKH